MATTTRMTRTTTNVRTTTHDLSMHGRAGAMLILLLITLALFIIAFATSGWASGGSTHSGLWETCYVTASGPGYLTAVQVFMCLALLALLIAIILVFLYLFATTVSKYQVLLGLVITTFLAFGLMLVAIIIYGAQRFDLYWSYAVAVITSIVCLAAGIVSAIQISRC